MNQQLAILVLFGLFLALFQPTLASAEPEGEGENGAESMLISVPILILGMVMAKMIQ